MRRRGARVNRAWCADAGWDKRRAVTPEQRLDTFRRFVERSPDDPFARYSLAMGYRSLGRSEEAACEFQELARRQPDYVPTYLMLGQVLEAMGRRPEAARAYQDGLAAARRAGNDHAASELGQALENLRAQGA
jgi:tetratricopeptide (TPR) repeat protein